MIIVFSPIQIVNAEGEGGGTIDGDIVWWENQYARLEVYPHTSDEILRQRQWANLTWKAADNTITVAFRFNSSLRYGRIQKLDGDSWNKITMNHAEYNGKHYYYNNLPVQQDTTYRFRWEYDNPNGANTSGKWDLIAKLADDNWNVAYQMGRYVMLDPWWSASYGHKQQIILESDYIDANLVNFPVLVNISAASSAKADFGNSVRFVDSTETTEYFYQYDVGWRPTTYNLAWVNVTSISSATDTVFYMYYNNSNAADAQSTSTWDNNFLGVYHLNEPSGTVMDDNTSNGNDGTYNGTIPTQVVGKVGYAQDLDGTDDWLTLPEGCHTPLNGTIEMWDFDEGDGTVASAKFYDRVSDVSDYFVFVLQITDDYDVYNNASILMTSTTTGFSHDYYQYLVFGWEAGSQEIRINTTQEDTDPAATPDFTYGNIWIGTTHVGSADMNGRLDEIRVSDIKRSDAWLDATYYTIAKNDFLTMGSEEDKPIDTVDANATTAIGTQKSTLNGYLPTGNGFYVGNYDYGFWVGTTTPVTNTNCINITGVATIAAGNTFTRTANDTLAVGTRYYAKAWVSNATYFQNSSGEVSWYTKPSLPTLLSVVDNACVADISWTKGTNATKTILVRNANNVPTTSTDGTVIYNSTGTSFSDSAAAGNSKNYSIWSYTSNQLSVGWINETRHFAPCNPTNINVDVLSNQSFEISWTLGTGSLVTVGVWKLGSYPTSVSDGNVIHNATDVRHVTSGSTSAWYYTLYAFSNNTFSSGVNVPLGGLVVNCYDEETNASLEFDIELVNQSGTGINYESRNNTNSLILNLSELPLDDKIKIKLSAAQNYSDKSDEFIGYDDDENSTITYFTLSYVPESKDTTNVTCLNDTDGSKSFPPFTLDGDLVTVLADDADGFTTAYVNYTHDEYYYRIYHLDLAEGVIYFLDTWLPPIDESGIYPYQLTVINQYDVTVEDVYIEVKNSVNGTYVVVSSLYTDANGQTDVFLVADEDYIFVLSKENYVTANASWTPGYYEYTKTFKILIDEDIDDIEPDFPYVFSGSLHTNSTLSVSTIDIDSSTTNMHFYIYEMYNGTGTYIGENTSTTSSSFTIWQTVTNTSRMHRVDVYANHSIYGEIINHSFSIYPLPGDRYEGTWLENLFEAVFGGDFEMGYSNMFIWYLPALIFIICFAMVHHPGLGVMFAGGYSFFLTWYIAMPNEATIIIFASIALVIGFIGIALKKGTGLIN